MTKFIQINAWRGYLYYPLIRFLRKEDADIVNLQEVNAGLKAGSEHFSLYEKLQKELKYKYSFYSPNAMGNLGGHTISEGHLILSKHPIVFEKTIPTRGRLRKSTIFEIDDTNVCMLQHVKIKIGEEIINDLNYKGFWIRGTKEGNKLTEQHSEKILKYMNSINPDEKIIFSGDFNLLPQSKSLKIISKNYTDLVLKYGVKTTRNKIYFQDEPTDNIFVNNKVNVSSLDVPMVYISDHLPMIMTFS